MALGMKILWVLFIMGLFVSLEQPTEEGPYSLKNESLRKMGGEY